MKTNGRVYARQLLSMLLVLALAFSVLPMQTFADGGSASGFQEADETGRDTSKQQVLVKVENMTFTPEQDPEGWWVDNFWYGTLVNRWVDINSDSTMMSALVAALDAEGISQTGASDNYVQQIGGLGEFDGGSMSGWMGTLNDWMVNEGFDAFTVARGNITDGDIINIMYTCAYGADLGGTWDSNDTGVSNIVFSRGTLDRPFNSSEYAYTLSVDSSTTEVTVTPTAANKNFQVRSFIGNTEYKRTRAIPVEDGTVITVKCGDPSWPTMNDGSWEATTYTFTVEKEQAGIPVTVNIANAASAKLFSERDTAMAEDLLNGTAPYSATLAEGNYKLALYDAGESCLGTIMLAVAGTACEFNVYGVTVSCGNEGWVCGTDYTVEPYAISGGAGASSVRQITLGESGSTFLCIRGDTITAKLVPSAERKAEGYAPATASKTASDASYTNLTATCGKAGILDVSYPYADMNNDGENDFVLEVGQMTNYFVYSYFEADSVGEPAENTVIAEYTGLSAGNYFVRVTNPLNNDAVTYGTYVSVAVGANAVAVTPEQLYIGADTNSDTVVDDFSRNGYDVADIYLSVSGDLNGSVCGYDGAAGQLSMSVGDTARLYPFRNWLAIESFTNAKVTEPDFHVQVVNLEGNPISVTEKTENDSSKHSFDISAAESGTALLLVTYDAMTHDVTEGMGGFFSAIWPKNTGVIVVTVGKEGGISKGMTINETLNLTEANKMAVEKYDAELDVLYFYGNEGGSYSYKPEEGTTVTVSRCGYENGAMTFGSFTSDGITVGEDGTVTVTGLPEGKSIVKLEKEGKVCYQVLRAEQTDIVIKDAGGNVYMDTSAGILNPDMAVAPGETVSVIFSDVYHPANKFSGFYNMNAKLILTKDGEVFASGNANQYQFASIPATHKVSFTIPADVSGSLTLGGTINAAGFGSYFGYHRVLTYEIGKGANMNAIQQNGYMGALPVIVLPVAQGLAVNVSARNLRGETLSDYTLTVKDAANAAVALTNGSFTGYPGKSYSYVLTTEGYPRELGSFTVPASAAGSYSVVITVADFAEGAWNGTDVKEPEQLNDVYQIGTGAELAWFAAKVSDGTAKNASAVLTADIELSNMDWTPIGTSSNAYAGSFDGQGHWINGLYINNASSDYQGLFGSVGASGIVRGLGVSGSVTGKNRTAGIVGNLVAGGQILECVNAAAVQGTKYVGGIAGWVGANTAAVRNCYNTGTIIGNGQMTGGVVGGANTTSQNGTIENCYNVGTVDSNSKTYCGAVAGGNSVANKTVNNYYLEGSFIGTGSNCNKVGTSISAEALKALATTLGEAYMQDSGDVNNGYPILTWQQRSMPHVHSLTAVEEKPATCTEEGNTAYWVCIECGKYFSDENAENEIGENSWVAPAKGHTDTDFDGICEECTEKFGTVASASVDYTSQLMGDYLHAPEKAVTVNANLAERYGFTDGISYTENVSVLDVLVQAHIDVFGDLFSKETASDYLVIGQSGSPDKQFAVDGELYYGGFFLNHGFANDGTESTWGGYNGTLVTTQPVESGDLVEFFFYEDDYFGDTYNWFESGNGCGRSFSVNAGKSIELTLKGFYAMNAYIFKDAAEMIASESAYEVTDAQLYLVNTETGALTAINGAVTDEDGKVTLSFADPGVYVIAAYGTEDCMFKQILSMTEIHVNVPISYHSCSLNNDLSINYYLKANDAAAFDKVWITFDAEGKETVAEERYTVASVDGEQCLRFSYSGIAAAEMGDEVSAVVHVMKNGTEFISDPDIYSIKSYCYRMLAKTENEAMKELAVAILNYGAASQTYFGHHSDSLVNEDLDEDQKMIPEYELTDVNTSKEDEAANVKIVAMSAVLGNQLDLKFYLSGAPETDFSDISVTVRYRTVDGKLISSSIPGSRLKAEKDGSYSMHVSGIAAPNFRQKVTLQIVENGVRTCEYVYSLESYCRHMIEKNENPELTALCKAIMAYGTVAANYFK